MRSRNDSISSPPSTIAEAEDAAQCAAVRLADDHVLSDVNQTTRQVTRVGRLQRGVGETLARAVRGDEVLQTRPGLRGSLP